MLWKFFIVLDIVVALVKIEEKIEMLQLTKIHQKY